MSNRAYALILPIAAQGGPPSARAGARVGAGVVDYHASSTSTGAPRPDEEAAAGARGRR